MLLTRPFIHFDIGNNSRAEGDFEATDEEEFEDIYFYCDGEFCTVPTRVVSKHDARGEILINGLWPNCTPMQFRVRAK